MTNDKKPTSQPQSQPKPLTDEEAANVKGGMGGADMGRVNTTGNAHMINGDSCKETTDTGIMGCSG